MRRILTVLLFIAAVLTAAFPVFADDAMFYVKSGYNGNETEFFAPDESDKITQLSISASGYSFSGDIDSQRRQMTHGILHAYANIGESPERTFYGTSSLNLSYRNRGYTLDDYSVIRFGVSVDADGGDVPESYPVSAVLETSDGGAYTFDFDVPTDSWSLVSIDLRNVMGEFSALSVSLSYERENIPDVFSCSAPYLGTVIDDAFISAERYSSDKLSADVGIIVPSGGRVRPSDGNAEISGMLLTDASPEHGTTAYFLVNLSGISSGSMSLGISYEGTTDEERYYTNKIALANSETSDECVIFPIEILDDIESFTLYFSDIVCTTAFRIESIRLIEGQSVPADGNYDIGTVSSLRRNGNSITFEGTMQRDAVRRFSGDSISFYAIPATSADDLNTAYLLGSIRMSTVFSYTADFTSLSGVCDTFLFFAAVREIDESGKNTLMPLSRPRYPDASPLSDSDVSVLGFSEAASVGVFEANVSHLTVNVDLCELLTDAGNGITVSYTDYDSKGGTARQIHFSHELLSSLDSEIDFYISSGTRVYLRLAASSAVEGLTYESSGSSYMPDLSRSGARYLWAAIVRYLSERYDGISGYILGYGVNSAGNVSYDAFMTDGELDTSKLTSYAASLASLARITYSAAGVHISDMPVIVPFVPAGYDGDTVPASLIAVLLTDRLSEIGAVPWVLQWMTEGDESDADFAELTSLRQRLDELELTLPAAYTFCLTPDSDAMLLSYGEYAESQRALGLQIPDYSDYAAGIFGEFYEKCESYRARAAFVSLEGHSLKNDHAFYSAIKNIGMTDRFVYEAEAAKGESTAVYNYTLFDFSDKYYPLGWIAGGGVKSCLTESSSLFADAENSYTRVLRSEFSEDLGFVDNTGKTTSGTAGITLRNLSRMYNFTEIDSLEFTLAIEPADENTVHTGSVTVVLVIGTDDYRAEYYASDAAVGEIMMLTCDLTEYEYRNAVDYIGMMVYSDSAVYLDLSGVRVGSNTLTENELTEMFTLTEDDGIMQSLVTAGLVIALAAVCSIIAIVILTHHDREEDERREAALAEASRYRRNRR